MNNLIGENAPLFIANGVQKNKIIKNFTLKQFIKKKYIILFFYNKIFTSLYNKELNTIQKEIDEFNSRNVKIIAILTNSKKSNLSLLKSKKKNCDCIKFPILLDKNKKISYKYGLLTYIKKKSKLIFYRCLFFIDKLGIIRYQLINDVHIGINIYEILRSIDSWQYFEINGELCPVNYKKK
ncbi:MAG: redoxin domain-containing protein [Candidatus Shikimatogenerans bostrichidophilus]|nr:MAG: redoxin domain-containing protein [Candidatus Shikimatogenerans bostrichidophilus]